MRFDNIHFEHGLTRHSNGEEANRTLFGWFPDKYGKMVGIGTAMYNLKDVKKVVSGIFIRHKMFYYTYLAFEKDFTKYYLTKQYLTEDKNDVKFNIEKQFYEKLIDKAIELDCDLFKAAFESPQNKEESAFNESFKAKGIKKIIEKGVERTWNLGQYKQMQKDLKAKDSLF